MERRITELERAAATLCDELAERDVAHPPAWTPQTFGERPADRRPAEQWDRGVRAIARYRIEHDLNEHVAALGPQPNTPHAQRSWRQADQVARQVQRRLGRNIKSERDRDIGLEL